MTKPLKVWGTLIVRHGLPGATSHGQIRAVVAVKSRAAAARAFGVGNAYLRDYGSTTNNRKEIEAAMSKPGTVFVHTSDHHNGELVPLEPERPRSLAEKAKDLMSDFEKNYPY